MVHKLIKKEIQKDSDYVTSDRILAKSRFFQVVMVMDHIWCTSVVPRSRTLRLDGNLVSFVGADCYLLTYHNSRKGFMIDCRPLLGVNVRTKTQGETLWVLIL